MNFPNQISGFYLKQGREYIHYWLLDVDAVYTEQWQVKAFKTYK